jgi:two-component system OmpR family sensor kinase
VITWVRKLPHRIRRAVADAPLRVQLVGAVLVLVFAALTASGIAGTRLLRNYLVGRTDSQLTALAGQVEQREGLSGLIFPNNTCRPTFGTSAYYVLATGMQGILCSSSTQAAITPPAVTSAVVGQHANAAYTLTSQNGHDWRILETNSPDGRYVVVGTPLDEVNRTVSHLARIDLFVSGIVLVLLVGFGGLIVRASLRPLKEIEETAAAIAEGDLSQRVPVGSTKNEVGRLSIALNGMLAQIETAFHDREQSEASARTSEERMRRFVADASHELRTPLTSIRGFAELYRQGAVAPGADLDRIMGRVEDEAKRMGLLVEDLLLLARLDQQRPLEQHPVDMLTIATDAVHDAHAVQPDRPIALDIDGAAAAIVLGDEARLRQVAGNLVTNALAHTPPDTAVTIRLATTSGPHSEVLLSVIDNGPGLAPADAERVFERFYRADASRTRIAGGSGLGLSIVAALVAAHGGQVRVHTAPGTGCAFEVRLPLLHSTEDISSANPTAAVPF